MTKLTHRYIARIVVEAKTALFVGSGEASLLKDALVVKDANGWPILPGTSITGVLRHALKDSKKMDTKIIDNLFGFQQGADGLGSRLIISHGHMMISENKVAEGLMDEDYASILAKFDNLPSRQHVRISPRGAAISGGLFVNEVVYKGTRFIFEIELKGTTDDQSLWEEILETISNPAFRIGSGTRNGYGNLAVLTEKSFIKVFDLSDDVDFKAYLNHNASLNKPFDGDTLNIKNGNSLTHYILDLTPDDFFIFSEGYGDNEADNKPIQEEIIVYNSEGFTFELQTLIPGSSVKGAIAHRTAFHYNNLKGRFADELIPNLGQKGREIAENLFCGSGNKAVNELFGLGAGFEWDKDAKDKIDAGYYDFDAIGESRRGHVIIDDIYLTDAEVDNSKIFNHVAIDRFTGGAMDTALFSEKVSHLKEGKDSILINLYLDSASLDVLAIQAFENALLDITKGLLPLGGMTTKGHGMFTGSLTKIESHGNEDLTINKYHTKDK